MGVPGSGKGTQAKKIAQKYGYGHISTGDLLRALDADANGNPEDKQKLAEMKSGKLVSDDLIYKLAFQEMDKYLDAGQGVVLDGAIRNVEQAKKYQELAKAYESLSKVDIFKGRIYKQQYWRFMVYENIFLSYGISASKKDAKTGFTSYKKPERILKIWLHNQRTAKKKSIAQKYAKVVHVGVKRALHEFPIISQIIKSNISIQKELKLNEEEIEYLMK